MADATAAKRSKKAELKTKRNDASVADYLASLPNAQRRGDAEVVLEIMQEATGEQPAMWGGSIIGFGHKVLQYASGRELDWFVIGLAPRKQALTLYLNDGFDGHADLLARLGPHSVGKGCLYIKKVAEVDRAVLEQLVADSVVAVSDPH